jgi:hypothetical protein
VIDFWATIGRICTDPGFHKALFDAGKPAVNVPATTNANGDTIGVNLQDLSVLADYFKGQGLIFSRQDVIGLNFLVHVLGHSSGNLRIPVGEIGGAPDDRFVNEIRDKLTKPDPIVVPDHASRAIFGLGCIDEKFLAALMVAGVSGKMGDLPDYLEGRGVGPNFRLDSGYSYEWIRELAKREGLTLAMTEYSRNKWEQPFVNATFGACAEGYTITNYQPIPAQTLAWLFSLQPDDPMFEKFSAAPNLWQQLKNTGNLLPFFPSEP